MPQYDTPISALFRERSKSSERAPDMTGKLYLTTAQLQDLLEAATEVGGKGYALVRLAGWEKQGQGGTYLSLRGQTQKDVDNLSVRSNIPRRSRPAQSSPPSDDIPF